MHWHLSSERACALTPIQITFLDYVWIELWRMCELRISSSSAVHTDHLNMLGAPALEVFALLHSVWT